MVKLSHVVRPFVLTLLINSLPPALPAHAAKAQSANRFYFGNREPLLPSPFIKLPVGAIKPEGWLRGQLTREVEGFSGRLTEISPWCKFNDSAWATKNGAGRNGWEELPYWLRGYIDLGYVTGDKRVIAESEKWVNAILASQRPDGYFGPESNRKTPDLWPNMVALYALRTHYDATGDKRVLGFMTRYFRYMSSLPFNRFLPGEWQKMRGGDNLDSIYWLYNRTGEPSLLELARVNHERTADWVGGIASLHGVNFAECFREPAQYYMQTKDPRYLRAAEDDLARMAADYGQVPGGMYGADENARPGYSGPRQGTETCSFVEMMYSDEYLLGITGDPKWADHCEDIAFNSFPASMTPDLRGLHYLTAPNQVQLDRANKAPMIQNGGDMFSYNPNDFRCCQHNAAFGWPYYAEHLWMATPGNGLAAVLYAPCSVTAKAGNGQTVRIVEETEYPFRDQVTLHMSVAGSTRFPLKLRIPCWCAAPEVAINGNPTQARVSGGWLTLERLWREGDTVQLRLPMALRTKVWAKNRGAVSVYRGPLAYSLKIGESWKKYASDPWPGFEVFPTTPWNYGLSLDTTNPSTSLRVVETAAPVADQPFTPQAAPIKILARGRRIPEWTLEANGMVGELQQGPIRSVEPEEEITLIPMGCARLRVSAFPLVDEGPAAHEWGDVGVTPLASFCGAADTPNALCDGVLPSSSADTTIPRFTWWDHRSSTEWVEYDFPKARKVGSCQVYWFDDEANGGQCRVPTTWRVLWWDGTGWQPVAGASVYGVEKNRMNAVQFQPVETARVRIEAQLKAGWSGGILEWRVGR